MYLSARTKLEYVFVVACLVAHNLTVPSVYIYCGDIATPTIDDLSDYLSLQLDGQHECVPVTCCVFLGELVCELVASASPGIL